MYSDLLCTTTCLLQYYAHRVFGCRKVQALLKLKSRTGLAQWYHCHLAEERFPVHLPVPETRDSSGDHLSKRQKSTGDDESTLALKLWAEPSKIQCGEYQWFHKNGT